ncbi:hypothetical protein KY285_004640 [Solanum tuberosum]|nr:hypothetical protein KY285_004640 [Solanum tuberosum]
MSRPTLFPYTRSTLILGCTGGMGAGQRKVAGAGEEGLGVGLVADGGSVSSSSYSSTLISKLST